MSRLFHRIEQVYTNQYIDKPWKTSMKRFADLPNGSTTATKMGPVSLQAISHSLSFGGKWQPESDPGTAATLHLPIPFGLYPRDLHLPPGHQDFNAPAVRPRTKYLCAKMSKSSTGIAVKSDAAAI